MSSERRKLIEVALPLEAINAACKADKDRKTGTIRNLHKWFAPMPAPAWRALLFAALVDDPGDEPGRARLRRLIEDLVTTGPLPPPHHVLARAREEIRRSNPDGLPLIADPFCGAGSTLIEAQRLGLSTFGSDLNPVPVLITRTLCDLLPRIAGHEPVAGTTGALLDGASPFAGFVADVQYYGEIVRNKVWSEIGHLYPGGPQGEIVIAWLWARTVPCPNPACRVEMPLINSPWLSKRKGYEAWLEPVVSQTRVRVKVATEGSGPSFLFKHGRGAFTCARCGTTADDRYLRQRGKAGDMGLRLSALAFDANRVRTFASATELHEVAGMPAAPAFQELGAEIASEGLGIRVPPYGMTTQADLYTPRQLTALDAFASAVAGIRSRVIADGGDEAYADAIATFLGLCVGKMAQAHSKQCRWNVAATGFIPKVEPAFGRPDLPITWDFGEANPFGGSVGDWRQVIQTALRAVPFASSAAPATTRQSDARSIAKELRPEGALVATDPPYFAHIGYADLSDYFYVWLRRALRSVHPDLFATVMAPRDGELIALPSRHGGDSRAAHEYFVTGFTEVFANLKEAQRPDLPMLVVYAHREEDAAEDGRGGWEAMLDAILGAGFSIVGTLPLHGTGARRQRSHSSNALATYVVMVCRPLAPDAPRISRRDLDRLMRDELRGAVADLQHASIAPVDLDQAVIGPGMAIFSRYSAVLEADGRPMTVGGALRAINRTLGEILDEQETDLDPDSRWAVAWFEQHGYEPGPFGDADARARAKGIAVDSLWRAGIVERGGGNVRLLRRDELAEEWDPATDARPTAWEAVQYLVRALESGGEDAAAALWARLGGLADPARELAYRLFQVCERRKMTAEAVAFNGLVIALSEIERLADSMPPAGAQGVMF